MVSLTAFFGKRFLKKQLDARFREIVFLNSFDELGEDIQKAVQEEKNHYVYQHGLTRQEVDMIWDNLGPVRIE